MRRSSSLPARASRVAAVATREFRAQTRSPLFWALLAWLFFLAAALNPLAMIPSGEFAVAGVRAWSNSPYALAPTFAIGGFFAYTFFAAFLATAAALRDEEARLEEILSATPLSRGERLGGQLCGVLGGLGIALAVHALAVAAFRELPTAFGAATATGPFRPSAYALAALAFAGPWILAVVVLTFVVVERARAPIVAYAVPLVAFSVTLLLFWRYQPRGLDEKLDRMLVLLDATGIRWLDRVLFAEDRGPAFYNVAPLDFDIWFVANRIGVLLVAGLALRWCTSTGEPARGRATRRSELRLSRAMPVAAAKASGHRAPLVSSELRPFGVLSTSSSLAPRSERWGELVAAFAIAKFEFLEGVRSPALALFTILLTSSAFDVAGRPTDLFGEALRLSAGAFAVEALPLTTILVVLVLLFAVVESWERDETTGFAPLLAASAASDRAVAVGRGAAHCGLAAFLQGSLVLTGVAALLSSGARVDWGPLLLVFGLVLGPTALLWIAFVSATHALTRSRPATLAIGLAALVATGVLFLAGQTDWVTNWPLFGALRWSDFGTFPLHGEELVWNRWLALASAAFLFTLSLAARRRREPDREGQWRRLRSGATVRRARGVVLAATSPFAIALLLAVRLEPEGASARDSRVAAGGFALENLELEISIDPEAGSADVDGAYELVQRSTLPKRALRFSVPEALGDVRWSVAGVPITAEREGGEIEQLDFARPVDPGSSVRVSFSYRTATSTSFTRAGGDRETFIAPAAVSLSSYRGALLPGVGASAHERFRFRMSVEVPKGFEVAAVGDLIAESVEGERRRSVWKSEVPVSAISLTAAPYEVERDARTAVLALPEHRLAALEVLAVATRALERYEEWFGPYPWRELRIAEVPSLAGQATAYPAHIAVAEPYGFESPPGASLSGGLPFRVIAHEVAHQWWGHLVEAGDGPGSGLLVEGLANYATLRLLDAERGPGARADFARDLESLYLERRRPSLERAILETSEDDPGGEAVLALRGALALDQLHRRMGGDRMLRALGSFVAEQRARPGAATAADLLDALRSAAVAPLDFDAFVAASFATSALPEFSWGDRVVTRRPDGYRLRAALRHSGFTGTVQIVASAANPALEERRTVAVTGSGETEIDWPVAFKPERLEVDPDIEILVGDRSRTGVDLDGALASDEMEGSTDEVMAAPLGGKTLPPDATQRAREGSERRGDTATTPAFRSSWATLAAKPSVKARRGDEAGSSSRTLRQTSWPLSRS